MSGENFCQMYYESNVTTLLSARHASNFEQFSSLKAVSWMLLCDHNNYIPLHIDNSFIEKSIVIF